MAFDDRSPCSVSSDYAGVINFAFCNRAARAFSLDSDMKRLEALATGTSGRAAKNARLSSVDRCREIFLRQIFDGLTTTLTRLNPANKRLSCKVFSACDFGTAGAARQSAQT
jgi:hypothetical protein